MSELKYNEGDKVRIKSKEWYNNNKDEYGNVHLTNKYGWMFTERDSRFCGKVVTILLKGTTSYAIVEDSCEGFWTDEMFECKIEKDMTRKEEIQHKAGSIADGMKQHYTPQSECKGYYEGFIDGGKYADSTMIEKSFMWFLKHGLEYVDGESAVEFNTKINDMWEAYRKAMEE